MDFKKRMSMRLYVGIGCAIFGVIAMITAIFFKDSEFLSSFGAVFLVLGIMKVIQYMRITKNEVSYHKREVLENDERNVEIYKQARSLSFTIYILFAAIAEVVFVILNMGTEATIMGYILYGFLIIYWICYFIVKRKY